MQHRHACNRAAWVGGGGRVHRVIRPYHQHHVGFGEIIVDFIHFQHDVVRHFRFGQQHIHVTRQTPCHGMNAKAHVHTCGAQFLRELGHWVLRLCHRHAVAWGDDDAAGIFEHGSQFGGLDFFVFPCDFFARSRRRSTKTTCNHRDERAVHRLTHDVRQNRTR